MFKTTLPATKETHRVYITEVNSLMMFREVFAVYFMNPAIPINALCGSRVEFLNVKADGVFSVHSPLKGKISGDHNPIKNVVS